MDERPGPEPVGQPRTVIAAKDIMTKVVLDCNVWDKLSLDHDGCARIRALCESGALEILVPDTLALQLQCSPFGGVPPWFPTSLTTDSVFVLNHTRLGFGRLGSGGVFTAHRGDSQQIADAVIVDSADTDADVFVSEDKRARKRYADLRGDARSLCYEEFRTRILKL